MMSNSAKLIVRFNYLTKPFYFPEKKAFRQFLGRIFLKEGVKLESLQYIFCDDTHLLGINKRFLNHDNFTDIITFSYASKNEPVMGECYISIERVVENALIHKTPFINELMRVIVHGVLHLCGYNDKSEDEIIEMRRLEDSYLKKWVEVKKVSRGT